MASGLLYAERAGTGGTFRESGGAAAAIKPYGERGLPAREYESIRWVTPVLLCEVAFTEWTQDGRIRHPSFQGLREDKEASDVKKEEGAKKTTARQASSNLTIAGITITHPDRVISETGHVTKGELAGYYAEVAPFILPGITGRPLSLLRCHPVSMVNASISETRAKVWGRMCLRSSSATRGLIFDLDPAPEVSFEALKLAVQDLRQRLQGVGLEPMLKCTGGKGLHVTVPLAGKDKWPAVKSFAAALAQEMVAAAPHAYIATMSKAKRTGRIFIDTLRNDYTATSIADYGVRARPGAPVAVPLQWEELESLKSASGFTMKEVLKRLKNSGRDSNAVPKGQTLPV